MIVAYLHSKTLQSEIITYSNAHLLKEAIWIDLYSPTKEEEMIVEQHVHFNIPTREEMVEIELSSRLYKEQDSLFMTALMLAQADSADPKLDSVTFIVTKEHLVTIRYIEPHAFVQFTANLGKVDVSQYNPFSLMIRLMDTTVDRLADILEFVGRRLDEHSKNIFRPQHGGDQKLDYQTFLQEIGSNGDLNTKARESLLTFNRLVAFFSHMTDGQLDNAGQSNLVSLNKDIHSLSDHANFISTKANFLLDATLGMVNIEQNQIIKIFSVAAVIFLPPTLVASIYGMNFHVMPELSWKYGYLMAIGMIVFAAWLPYKYFKYRKWL